MIATCVEFRGFRGFYVLRLGGGVIEHGFGCSRAHCPRGRNYTLSPKHLRGPKCASASIRITHLSYILSILANHVRSDPCLYSTNSSSVLFDEVKHHGDIEDLSSNMQLGCPWMQIHT